MSATALQLIQQTMSELGLPSPTAVATSTDSQVKQFLALLNASGYELSRQYDWQAMTKQYVFTTSSLTCTGDTTSGTALVANTVPTLGLDATYQITGTGINQGTYVSSMLNPTNIILTQPATATATGSTFTIGKVKYPMPSDFDRLVDRTQWDKTKHWEALGPTTAQEWEWLLSGFIATGPRIRFRMLGGYFQIWPMVTTRDSLGFEYVSNAWAASAGGTAQSAITADTDTCIFPDRLMVLATKLKFWSIKGFDTSEIRRDYDMELSISKANDGGSKTLSMAPQAANFLIGWDNIPDSGYGS